MAENILQIGARVDLGQFQAGMSTAVATVQTASSQMATANQTAIASAEQFGTAAQEAGQKAAYSYGEARHAAMLLGEETGVRIPRALAMVAAHSEILGPILQSAFSGIALIAFAELLFRIGEKVTKIVEKFTDWTDIVDMLGAKMGAVETHLAGIYKQTAAAQLEAANVGKSRSEQLVNEYKQTLNSALTENAKLETLKSQLNVLNQHIEARKKAEDISKTQVFGPGAPPPVAPNQPQTATDEEIKKAAHLRTEIRDTEAEYGHLQETATKVLAEIGKAQIDEAKKAGAELNKQWTELDRELTHAKQELDKEIEHGIKEQSRIYGENAQYQLKTEEEKNNDIIKGIHDQVEAADILAKAVAAAQDEELTQELNNAKAHADIQKGKINNDFSIGLIGFNQKIALLRQVENEEYASESRILHQKATLYERDIREHQKYLDQIQQLENQHNKAIAALNDQSFAQRFKTLETAFQSISRAFSTSVNGMIQGTQTLQQAFAHLGASILASLADSLAQMGLKWVETHLLMAAAHALFGTQVVAQQAISDAQLLSLKLTTNNATVLTDSGVAFANAYAPLAAVPPAAAAAGAAASAAVLAGGIRAFAQGGIVPSTGIGLLHANERVIPEDISGRILDRLSGGGGGGSTVHITIPIQASAIDAKGLDQMLSARARHIARLVRQELRRQNVSLN